MNKWEVNVATPWWAAGIMVLSILMLTGCIIDPSQYVMPYESWKEEVALQDGRMLIVERSLSYGRSAGIGQGRLIEKRTLDFVIPSTQQKVHWEGDEHVIPMLLDFKGGVPYLATMPFSCNSFDLLGRPIPPYVLYKYTGQWEGIVLADFPLEFSQANLSVVAKEYIQRLAGESMPSGTGYVPARMIKNANATLSTSYHTIIRNGKGEVGGCLRQLEQLDVNRRK